MKKIAIVDIGSFSLPYDYYYIKELVRNGYEVDFFCSETKYNDIYIKKLKNNNNVNVFIFKISSSVVNKYYAMKEYLRFLITLFKNRNKYHYIHFMWSDVWLLDLLLFYLIKNKLIFTFHNHIPHNKDKYYFPYKIIFYLSKKVVFVSDFTKREFIKTYNITKLNKIFLFNHGILPVNLKYQDVEENDVFEKTLIFWGNVKEYKGIDFFLNLLQDSRFKEWKIEIYGKWDKSLIELKNILLNYDNVFIKDKFLNEEELRNLFTKKGIFILPYKKATQSGVLYTLLYYCKVFVSTPSGDNGEFLEKNNLKDLIFNNCNSLYKCLIYVNKNYNHLKSIFCKIRDKFNWDKTLKNIGSLYE